MRASDFLRASPSTAYIDVGTVTRNPLCFANANTNGDLRNPKPRGTISGAKRPDLRVSGEAKKMYLRGLESLERGDRVGAVAALEIEAERYERLGVNLIALHCRQDQVRLAELAGLSPERAMHAISALRAALEPQAGPRGKTS